MTEVANDNPLRVLLLEDEPFIVMDLQFAFEDAGIDTVVASTVDRALALIETEHLDAAVLDVNLGHGRTCEPVAIALRGKNVPFVLHTGDLDRTGELLRNMRAPIVPKPTVTSEVVGRVVALVPPKAAATARR